MATEMKPIRTEADYEAALEEVPALWGAAAIRPASMLTAPQQ
jgi:antitoxin component HigA of HigAB toxin-antitoxin module